MKAITFRKPLLYGLLSAALLILTGRYVLHSKLSSLPITPFSEYYAMDKHRVDTASDETGPGELNLANTNLRNLIQVSSPERKLSHKTGEPILLMFTTWDSPAGNDMVRRSVLRNWSWLKPAVIPVLFTSDPDAKTEALLHGWHSHNVTEQSCYPNATPTLRSMFYTIVDLYGEWIPLLGFATGDTLFDESIVSTFQVFIREQLARDNERFVVLGKRTDVLLESGVELESGLDVRQWSRKGNFAKEGLSGFFVTNRMFPWSLFPHVNGALQGVYEWIGVACTHNYVPLYDITATALSVHIHTKPTAAQRSLAACNEDIINKSGPHPPNNHCGHTECFTLRSKSTTGGHIKFYEIATSALPESCNDCVMTIIIYIGLTISYVGVIISYAGGSKFYAGDSKFYVGDSKFYAGDSKFYVGDSKSYAGDSKFYAGDSKFYVGDSKFYAGDSKFYVGDSKFYVGDSKFYVGDSKSYAGDSKFYAGDSKFYVGDSKFYAGDSKFYVGDSKFYVGDSKFYVGDSKSYAGDSKFYAGDSKFYVGDSKFYAGDSKFYVGDSKFYVGDSKFYVGDSKSYVGDSKFYAGDSKFYVGDSKFYAGDSKFYVGDSKFYVGDSKFYVGDSKFYAGDSKFYVGDSKFYAGDSKFYVGDNSPLFTVALLRRRRYLMDEG
ncbi:uncharacterized protein [Haliotis asinina]|uniref:uncharacterized protein n=1 Tax=Haliotis asinina TaxID=109174 RepID=UPI0035321549